MIPKALDPCMKSMKVCLNEFKHVNVAHFSQVEAFSLEEPVHSEPQTTPQEECLLLDPLQTPLLHPRQDPLEVDLILPNPHHSILGKFCFLCSHLHIQSSCTFKIGVK